MIAKLTGRIEQLEADRCIVDVNGVGYLVHASTRTLSSLPGGSVAGAVACACAGFSAAGVFGFALAAIITLWER